MPRRLREYGSRGQAGDPDVTESVGTVGHQPGAQGGPPPRPYEGRDFRRQFHRRHTLFLVVDYGYLVYCPATMAGAFCLGCRVAGMRFLQPFCWLFVGWALATGFSAVTGYLLRRCPACKARFLRTDWKPMHCACGALLNDTLVHNRWA